MKKILSFFLCLVLCFALVACGEGPASTDTATGTGSTAVLTETGTDTDTDTVVSSQTEAVTDPVTDPESEETTSKKVIDMTSDPDKLRRFDEKESHLIIATDIKNYSFVVIDMNKASAPDKINEASAVVWEWKSQESGMTYAKKYAKNGVDDAKLRHSAYYGCDVVIACSSLGWAGIIEYPSGKQLLDLRVTAGPHSVELLPNGDLAVACAGTTKAKGVLNYYAVSRGGTVDGSKPDATYLLDGCHGACWNPDLNLLLIDGYPGIVALKIGGMNGGTVTLTKDKDHSVDFTADQACHDMMPVAGTAGKQYYVADGSTVWIYEPATAAFYRATGSFATANVKGIASFRDLTVVTTVPGGKGKLTQDWSTCTINVYTYQLTTGKVVESRLKKAAVYFPDREFYKVHNFDINYYF